MNDTNDITEVKKLREDTGMGIMACRKALEEAGGDLAVAKEALLEGAREAVSLRADRATAEGIIAVYVHKNERVGALVELCSETDFVSRSSEFRGVGRELAMQVCAMAPESVEELLAQEWIRDPGRAVGDLVSELQAKTKENIVVRRFVRLEIGG